MIGRADRSAREIQQRLAKATAQSVSIEFGADGDPGAMTFRLTTPPGGAPISLAGAGRGRSWGDDEDRSEPNGTAEAGAWLTVEQMRRLLEKMIEGNQVTGRNAQSQRVLDRTVGGCVKARPAIPSHWVPSSCEPTSRKYA
jgi:hypothetical protein